MSTDGVQVPQLPDAATPLQLVDYLIVSQDNCLRKVSIEQFELSGITGPQGFQGDAGPQGSQGDAGPQGFQGAFGGPQGFQGFQGATGATGSQGLQGQQGLQGATGATGAQGNQGFQGAVGSQGLQGDVGDTGAQGSQGRQGLQGFQGDVGVQGNQGFQGDVGATGAQGFQGKQGFQGDVGDTGAQGSQGRQGFQGTTGATGAQGFQGQQGFQGVTGTTGAQGAQGFQGDVGDTGLQGSQGAQGRQGTTGATGAQGDVGAQGFQGFRGITGATGAQGAQGNQGDVGSTGAQGAQGFQGDVGATGAQGDQGFQGQQGFQGLQGAQGDQGFQGLQGNQGFQGAWGGPVTIAYTFSTTTTDTDPGNGNLCLSDATQNASTVIRAENLDAGSSDWTAVLATFAVSTNATKGYIRLVNAFDATQWLLFSVSAVAVGAGGGSGSGYSNVTVANVGSSSNSPFGNGDSILLCFEQVGDQGFQGNQGFQGLQGSTGAQGNQGFQGRQGFQGDVGATGATGAQGNQGFQGDVGAQGNQGFQGKQGFQGDVGATGSTGAQGFQGLQGNQGFQGLQGNQGFQGLQGAQGFQGNAGGPITIAYTFSTTTTDSDPGSGNLRLSNATQNASTVIRADDTDSGGTDWTAVLATLADSTNTIKGHIRLVKATDATKWLVFTVSSLASPTNYKNVTVVNVGSSAANPFANADPILLCFECAGNVGAQGLQGSQGAQGLQGSQGNQGNQGNQGRQGNQGFQGFQGLVTALETLIPGGRLTITSLVPVTIADVTSATTLYYTPYRGDCIALYDGSSVWTLYTFAELSLALSGMTASKNYDVFAYLSSGNVAIDLGPAWTTDALRGSGAGTTELVMQNGVLVNKNAVTGFINGASIGAKTGRYVGTIRSISATATADSSVGTTQNGGQRFVWNAYNRISRDFGVFDTTVSWPYTSTTVRLANGVSPKKNCTEYVVGLNEDVISATLIAAASETAVGPCYVGIGVNATGGAVSGLFNRITTPTTAPVGTLVADYRGFPGLGYNYLAWLESGNTGVTFYGQASGGGLSGINATMMC